MNAALCNIRCGNIHKQNQLDNLNEAAVKAIPLSGQLTDSSQAFQMKCTNGLDRQNNQGCVLCGAPQDQISDSTGQK